MSHAFLIPDLADRDRGLWVWSTETMSAVLLTLMTRGGTPWDRLQVNSVA